MITLRRSDERGRASTGWIDSRYAFSFGQYRDRVYSRFSVLRALNEDVLSPGTGYPEHPHRDIDIVTYLVAGELEHRDSMGHRQRLRRTDVQCLSAGRGLSHSELNPSDGEPTRLFQIWITPSREGTEPDYQRRHFSDDEKRGHLRLLASPDGRGGSLRIHQDASLYATLLATGQAIDYEIAPGRRVYLQVVDGCIALGDHRLESGDAAAIEALTAFSFSAGADDTEVLLFDLP